MYVPSTTTRMRAYRQKEPPTNTQTQVKRTVKLVTEQHITYANTQHTLPQPSSMCTALTPFPQR
jgi:hypothetical protein